MSTISPGQPVDMQPATPPAAACHVCSTAVTGNKVTVTIEGANPTVVAETAAKQLAELEAKKHLATPGLSENNGAYPVDEAGNCTDDVALGKAKVGAYRAEYVFQGL